MMKKSAVIFFLFIMTFITSGYKKPDVYKIDATKNAAMHNNIGLQEVTEHNYYAAIQEFALAIALNPKTQATAVYFNNLGEVYMKVGLFKYAQDCFEKSITQYNLNFLYYQNLVASFKAQNTINIQIKRYESKKDNNPLNMIMLGLMYAESGNIDGAITKLDEFCMKEPDLLITGAVRNYINELVQKNQ